MSRHHGRMFTQKTKGVHIAALCDPHAENLARYQREIFDPINQRPPTFPDYRDMLRQVDLDAVAIVTPHTHHFQQAMDALAAGKHILLEKPMVTSLAHARKLMARIQQTKRIVTLGFPGSFTPEFHFIRDYVTAGKLGDVKMLDAFTSQNWLTVTRGTWRQDPALSGGGQAYDTGAHLFHGLLYLSDLRPVEVTAQIDRCGTRVDINSLALIRFDNGALASATVIGADVQSWDNAIYLSGTHGSLRTDIHGGKLELWNATGQRIKYPRVNPVASLHQNFVDTIRGRAENLCPPLWGLRQALFMDAFYQSAQTGRPARVAKE
jgi:predicted dehydrogenase